MNNRWLFLIAVVICLGLSDIAMADYTVHAKGRLVFRDGSTKKPLPRVLVQLMDSDIDYDEVMKQGRTNKDGKYDLTGHAEDSWTVCSGCDHPDPYMKFILNEKNRVDVRNLWGFTHYGVSHTVEDTQGTINFGELEFEEKLYPLLFAYAQYQYRKFTTLTGDTKVPGNNGLVGILVPEVFEDGVPWTGVDAIHWPGDYFLASGMFHEFGHRIRHGADGDANHFNGDLLLFRYARHHSAHDHTNLGFAFNEGWAQYFKTLSSTGALHTARTWEMDNNAGDEMEGNVTHKLWKLSMLCGGFNNGFKNMWTALKAGTGKSIDGGPALAQSGIHSYVQFRKMLIKTFPNSGCGDENLAVSSSPRKTVTSEVLTSSLSKTVQEQNAALKRVTDNMDALTAQPIKVKWSATRIAKLPTAIRPAMTRLVDKRTAHASAHATTVQNAIRTFMSSIEPATEKSREDGSYAISIETGQARLLKAIAEPRLEQISEIKNDLKREYGESKDARFKAYITRLLAKYTEHEADIKKALTTPGAEIPEILVPLSLRSLMIKSL